MMPGDSPAARRRCAAGVAWLAIAFALPACSPPSALPPPHSITPAMSAGEAACEDTLVRLDLALAAAEADPSLAAATTEARALRREALERIATGDYELALDLLNAALGVLGADG